MSPIRGMRLQWIQIYLSCTLLHWVILVLSEGQHSAVEFICYAWLSDLSDANWFESYPRDETELILFFNLTSRYQSCLFATYAILVRFAWALKVTDQRLVMLSPIRGKRINSNLFFILPSRYESCLCANYADFWGYAWALKQQTRY